MGGASQQRGENRQQHGCEGSRALWMALSLISKTEGLDERQTGAYILNEFAIQYMLHNLEQLVQEPYFVRHRHAIAGWLQQQIAAMWCSPHSRIDANDI
jgi:hypothetical protein